MLQVKFLFVALLSCGICFSQVHAICRQSVETCCNERSYLRWDFEDLVNSAGLGGGPPVTIEDRFNAVATAVAHLFLDTLKDAAFGTIPGLSETMDLIDVFRTAGDQSTEGQLTQELMSFVDNRIADYHTSQLLREMTDHLRAENGAMDKLTKAMANGEYTSSLIDDARRRCDEAEQEFANDNAWNDNFRARLGFVNTYCAACPAARYEWLSFAPNDPNRRSQLKDDLEFCLFEAPTRHLQLALDELAGKVSYGEGHDGSWSCTTEEQSGFYVELFFERRRGDANHNRIFRRDNVGICHSGLFCCYADAQCHKINDQVLRLKEEFTNRIVRDFRNSFFRVVLPIELRETLARTYTHLFSLEGYVMAPPGVSISGVEGADSHEEDVNSCVEKCTRNDVAYGCECEGLSMTQARRGRCKLFDKADLSVSASTPTGPAFLKVPHGFHAISGLCRKGGKYAANSKRGIMGCGLQCERNDLDSARRCDAFEMESNGRCSFWMNPGFRPCTGSDRLVFVKVPSGFRPLPGGMCRRGGTYAANSKRGVDACGRQCMTNDIDSADRCDAFEINSDGRCFFWKDPTFVPCDNPDGALVFVKKN